LPPNAFICPERGVYAISAFALLGSILFLASGISDYLTISASLYGGTPESTVDHAPATATEALLLLI